MNAALFLREYAPFLAVVDKPGRDDFQQHFACMGNKRNPSVVVFQSEQSSFREGPFDDRILTIYTQPSVRWKD